MTRFPCSCPEPRVSPNPRTKGTCNACLGLIDPSWTSNDRTTSSFYSGLAKSIFPYGPTGLVVPEEYKLFQLECEERERAGRGKFGHRHLDRNNRRDAREETADLANYMLFDHLQETRRSGRDDDMALVLMAAKYAYLAYKTTFDLGHRRQGAP